MNTPLLSDASIAGFDNITQPDQFDPRLKSNAPTHFENAPRSVAPTESRAIKEKTDTKSTDNPAMPSGDTRPISFIGDVHGYTTQLQQLTKDKTQRYIVLGDMGCGFDKIPVFDNVTFLRGNHDSPTIAHAHPNYLGDYGMQNDIFFLSGAYSIDFAWRKREMKLRPMDELWWRDEELPQKELNAAIKLYKKMKPEIVATHEAPSSIIVTMLNELNFRYEKLECADSRTAKALEAMFNYHKPKRWVFGHYHISWKKRIGRTLFQCFSELEVGN